MAIGNLSDILFHKFSCCTETVSLHIILLVVFQLPTIYSYNRLKSVRVIVESYYTSYVCSIMH